MYRLVLYSAGLRWLSSQVPSCSCCGLLGFAACLLHGHPSANSWSPLTQCGSTGPVLPVSLLYSYNPALWFHPILYMRSTRLREVQWPAWSHPASSGRGNVFQLRSVWCQSLSSLPSLSLQARWSDTHPLHAASGRISYLSRDTFLLRFKREKNENVIRVITVAVMRPALLKSLKCIFLSHEGCIMLLRKG